MEFYGKKPHIDVYAKFSGKFGNVLETARPPRSFCTFFPAEEAFRWTIVVDPGANP